MRRIWIKVGIPVVFAILLAGSASSGAVVAQPMEKDNKSELIAQTNA